MTPPSFLSRGIDYLGDLGAKLRDLQGYRTLAHELIQNADDAATATSMRFDVRDDALIVDNDGVFSDCRQIEQPECPWKDDGTHQHRCDFHRFRHIASGDKRGESGTTGAFGIGFIAVYQITDRPELISAGRHWILNEDKPEDQRIQVCSGCAYCLSRDLPGTRFILPWARNTNSTLRKALQAEPVPSEGPQRMVEELERSLPVAMLFLKRLRVIEIRSDRQSVHRFERLDEGNSLILSDGAANNDRVWHIIRGDFLEAADKLRLRHPGRIEPKRSPLVALAIPATARDTGLLCACLPTEQDEGLPFHVNADFFTTNDRKRVVLAADYQSEWNREALKAAGRAIGTAVGRLPDVVGAKRFWQLVSTLKEIAERSKQERGEPTLAEFWNHVAPQLRTAPVVQTTTSQWMTAADTCLLLQREEADVVGVLEALGVHIAHEDLRPFQSLLRSEPVSVPVLDVERISKVLTAIGLNRRTELRDLPPGLDTLKKRVALWTEIATLLDRQQHTPKAKAEDERRLLRVALAPGRDGALWPGGDIYSGDNATVTLFEALGLGIPFVASDSAFAPLVHLCQPFNATAAVEALGRNDRQELERLWRHGQLPLWPLFEWFENRRQEIFSDPGLKKKLAALPLFPSSGILHPLSKLALPGNFSDPLGLAELVDVDALGGRREFLQDLGMPELDFSTYVTSRLPDVLSGDNVSAAKRRAAVFLLASRVGELKDNEAARSALADTPLVECTDGVFRRAQECHFDSEAVRDCFGGGAHLAVLPKGHEVAVRDLYEWLGVAAQPRFEDIVARVQDLSSNPYSPAITQQIQKVVTHLGKRVESDRDFPELARLKSHRWFPARGRNDRWYAPSELYAAYQAYLFESQAVFVDVPAPVQNTSRSLLEFLGVRLTPPVGLVVRHLLHNVVQQIPVNTEVYRFLNDNAGDAAIDALNGKECLWLGTAYYTPNHVFWSEHRFGRYRQRLGDELRNYSGLLKQLGVRETPTWEDALSVLREIATDFGSHNTPLDDEAHTVLIACWRAIGQALDEGAVRAQTISELHSVKCIPNASRVLNPPEWMFFENRAGLAAKFGSFLSNNVIPRPIGVGRALDQAGVRALGTAVQVELLECVDPVDDPAMSDRLRVRSNQIGRVLEPYGTGHDTASALKRLDSIRCVTAVSIEIRYRLRAFNRELQSVVELVPALYQAEQETLLFTYRNGVLPWAAIARELATALFPEEDPGRFAAGFKEALAAESAAEAAATLDELGFARLDTSAVEPASTVSAAGTLGTDAPVEGGIPPAELPGDATEEDDKLSPEESVKRLLGEDAPPPTPSIVTPDTEPLGTSSPPRGGKAPGASRKKSRPVLRSYLPAPEIADSLSTAIPDTDDKGRSPVDQAGIRRVMNFESAAGRTPKEMPHKNPGYDIESRDATGKIARYVEVKSFSGQWRDTYAVLSRPQFDKALDLGDLFWLYVVERAESDDDFSIHRIQNPPVKANHFMFDDGWRATAEAVPVSEEGDSPNG